MIIKSVSYEEVLKTIRDKKNLIPILMLTAKAEIDDKVEGLDLGANDYLTKPFAAKELLARIRTMIRTQTTQTESILHVGNITLNRATFELTSPTGSFRLANKEFQMMELFLCNQGHSITHKRLMEKIWGDEKQVQTNVVWMYISYLRKKLEALHANLQITEASHAEYILEVGG
ncbi:response regulator transcription factor [Anaerostipes hadrus]|uniref:response regulator transcription factor n=1 Tax=Anaerostipes hadrus TaxID=649756 RepID=UPI002ED1FF8E